LFTLPFINGQKHKRQFLPGYPPTSHLGGPTGLNLGLEAHYPKLRFSMVFLSLTPDQGHGSRGDKV
jgi:hypothetical protein